MLDFQRLTLRVQSDTQAVAYPGMFSLLQEECQFVGTWSFIDGYPLVCGKTDATLCRPFERKMLVIPFRTIPPEWEWLPSATWSTVWFEMQPNPRRSYLQWRARFSTISHYLLWQIDSLKNRKIQHKKEKEKGNIQGLKSIIVQSLCCSKVHEEHTTPLTCHTTFDISLSPFVLCRSPTKYFHCFNLNLVNL